MRSTNLFLQESRLLRQDAADSMITSSLQSAFSHPYSVSPSGLRSASHRYAASHERSVPQSVVGGGEGGETELQRANKMNV